MWGRRGAERPDPSRLDSEGDHPPYALDNPAQVLDTQDGALLVAERGTRNRILRVDSTAAAFTVTTFARSLSKPNALTRARGGAVYVMEAGDVARASGALRRVATDGSVTTIRLIER